MHLLLSFVGLVYVSGTSSYTSIGTGSCVNADGEQYPRVMYRGFSTTEDCADWCYNVKESSVGFSTLMNYCQCEFAYNNSIYPNHTEVRWEHKYYAHNNYGRASGDIITVDPSTAFTCHKFDSLKVVAIPENRVVYKGEGTCYDTNIKAYDKAAYTGVSEVVACQNLCYSKVTSVGFELDEQNDVCYCLFDDNNQVFPDDSEVSLSVTSNLGTGVIDYFTNKPNTYCYSFSGAPTTLEPTGSPTNPTTNSPSTSPSMSPSIAPTTSQPVGLDLPVEYMVTGSVAGGAVIAMAGFCMLKSWVAKPTPNLKI